MIIQCIVEAKYVSTSLVTSQPIQLRRVLEDVDENQEEVASILCDNKATLLCQRASQYLSLKPLHLSIMHTISYMQIND